MKEVRLLNLGRLSYSEALKIQHQCHEEVLDGSPDTLIFVEHDPVLTLGAAFHAENLLFPVNHYERQGITVTPTDRGGDITYHGPGQLTIYPIFDVAGHGKDLHKWLRDLEEVMILTLATFGLEGYRKPPHTGAWCNEAKVAAIGVKVRRWVNLHGIALNVDLDLAPFRQIVPCGIKEFPVTTLAALLSRSVGLEEVKPVVASAFESVFGLTVVPADEFMIQQP